VNEPAQPSYHDHAVKASRALRENLPELYRYDPTPTPEGALEGGDALPGRAEGERRVGACPVKGSRILSQGLDQEPLGIGYYPIPLPNYGSFPEGTADHRQVTISPVSKAFPKVGATRDVRSLTRQHVRKTPEKSAGLCPYPFPFQIWFDGDAVRARSQPRRPRDGS
jgi:hypothetical protein